jgi:hypothetical protein
MPSIIVVGTGVAPSLLADGEGENEFAAQTLRPFSPISAFTRVFDAQWGRRTG